MMSWSQTLGMLCRLGLTVALIFFSHSYDVKADVIAYRADNDTSERFNSMPSNFGARIPNEGLVGHLVKAEPYNGCQQLVDPPKTNKTTTAWFALIRRNECDFDLKVLNAQRAGYTAVVVHNAGSNNILPMSGNKYSQQVFIPSVFVGENDGLNLAQNYNYTTGNHVKITPYITLPPGYYLFPFITVTGTCLLFFAIYTIAKYVRDRRRLRRARLSRDHLKKLPIKKFKKGDDYDICAICLDEYDEGDKLRILPCNHAFHSKCVDPWLTNNKRTCPVCKRKVVPNGIDDSSDSDSSDDDDDGPTEHTPLLNASIGNPSGSESSGSPRRIDASTAMTPAEDSSCDEESIVSSSDSYEMSHTENRPSQSSTEIQIEHEVVIERPDESDSYDDMTDTDDDDNARLQKV